jgi:hypothetical protein
MRLIVAAVAGVALFAGGADARATLSDAQIKQRIIGASIADYPGTCACPYSVARNGSSCGGRSAWSRPGGYAPLCYSADITKAEIAAWRSGRGATQ